MRKLIILLFILTVTGLYAVDVPWPHINSLEPVVEVDMDSFLKEFNLKKNRTFEKDYPFKGSRYGSFAHGDLVLQYVLKETNKEEIFYRLIYLHNVNGNLVAPFEEVYYLKNNKLILWMGASFISHWDVVGRPVNYETNSMIINNNGKLGLMFTVIETFLPPDLGLLNVAKKDVEENPHDEESGMFYEEMKKASSVPDEKNRNFANVFWADENYELQFKNITEYIGAIEIETKNILIDKNDSFRYTIQNAFDGDPATSFVEDTKNDLFLLSIRHNIQKDSITRVDIINGFAKNPELYLKNNRIKELSFGYGITKVIQKNILLDNMLEPQKVHLEGKKLRTFKIICSGLYIGSEWNDTCISEIRLFNNKNILLGISNE